ncbi:MAG TPA: hypothetical protein VGA67_05795 [Candidatus Dojkabacteria bacterium]
MNENQNVSETTISGFPVILHDDGTTTITIANKSVLLPKTPSNAVRIFDDLSGLGPVVNAVAVRRSVTRLRIGSTPVAMDSLLEWLGTYLPPDSLDSLHIKSGEIRNSPHAAYVNPFAYLQNPDQVVKVIDEFKKLGQNRWAWSTRVWESVKNSPKDLSLEWKTVMKDGEELGSITLLNSAVIANFPVPIKSNTYGILVYKSKSPRGEDVIATIELNKTDKKVMETLLEKEGDISVVLERIQLPAGSKNWTNLRQRIIDLFSQFEGPSLFMDEEFGNSGNDKFYFPFPRIPDDVFDK